MGMTLMTHTREFDCIECGRHIISIGAAPWDAEICCMCVHMPGWFRNPDLRAVLDPDMTLADAPPHEQEEHEQ